VSTGQFVSVTVQQHGIDVGEKVFAPDRKLVAEFDEELRPQEEERAEFVAETDGPYRLDVVAKFKGASGRYEIRLAEVRVATEHDRLLHEAHKLITQFWRFERAGKYDDALPPAERALEIAEKELGPDNFYLQRIRRVYS